MPSAPFRITPSPNARSLLYPPPELVYPLRRLHAFQLKTRRHIEWLHNHRAMTDGLRTVELIRWMDGKRLTKRASVVPRPNPARTAAGA